MPGRRVYCCSGCALAARISAGGAADAPPPAPALVAALGLGFAYFNQLLLWLLAVLLAREEAAGRAPLDPGSLAWMSLGLACVVWNLLACAQIFLGARRPADWAVLTVSGAGLVGAVWGAGPAMGMAATTLLGAWALRGLAKKKTPGKNGRDSAPRS